MKMLRSEYKRYVYQWSTTLFNSQSLVNLRVRALFMEADDGEVAVELLKKEMNGEGSGFDFVLMDNIMVNSIAQLFFALLLLLLLLLNYYHHYY